MKIYLMLKNGMIVSLLNSIKKLFKFNYRFYVPIKLVEKSWNDKHGSPIIKKVVDIRTAAIDNKRKLYYPGANLVVDIPSYRGEW